MRFGLCPVGSGRYAEPEMAAGLATTAEDCGFDSLWISEHVVIPREYESQYPYSRNGRWTDEIYQTAIPDPFVWLTFVAAVTSRIRLGTAMLILPQRNPLIVAKQAATLDHLSLGRMVLGVGAGWCAEEFQALGVPFERRADRLNEYIHALRAAWASPESSFEGEYVRWSRCTCLPAPVTKSIPIVIGGDSHAAARRAGQVGDGFFPGRVRMSELAELAELVKRTASEYGRHPDAIELIAGAPRDLDDIKRLADLGYSRLTIVPPSVPFPELRDALNKYAESTIARVD